MLRTLVRFTVPALLGLAIVSVLEDWWVVLALMCVACVLLPVRYNPAYWHLIDPLTGERTEEGKRRG